MVGGGVGDDGRRGEGTSVGQIDQLPVSNRSREEGTEEKVGGRQRKVCFAPVWSAVNGTGRILLGGTDQAGGSVTVLIRVRKSHGCPVPHHCLQLNMIRSSSEALKSPVAIVSHRKRGIRKDQICLCVFNLLHGPPPPLPSPRGCSSRRNL